MFKLNGSAGFTTSGTVQVDVKAYGYTITVTVNGLSPNTRHQINIHDGNCATQGVNTNIPVEGATADANGTITSVTTWPNVYLIPPEGRILTVHGTSNTSDEYTHIACADLTN